MILQKVLENQEKSKFKTCTTLYEKVKLFMSMILI